MNQRSDLEKVERIFNAVVDQPRAEWRAILDRMAGSDMAIREQVERMLSAPDGAMDTFMQTASAKRGNLVDRIPDRIGQFTIRRLIAEGGMGAVYEAKQENPERIIALKVVNWLATGCALRRFEYESQVLARLRHTGIAQIFAAGTHVEGNITIPYFAMEIVPDAKPITEYGWEKKLAINDRLGLFLQVCDAVHHGHQNGIIHRDLKPSNILVDKQGQTKVIDFGIARATDPDDSTLRTQTGEGHLIGTPQYMSPEQVAADPQNLDIRTDIYSLGLVLYELVCEKLPYDLKGTSIFDAIKIIREQSPARPAVNAQALPKDLEIIILKALEKDPVRRYQSAGELGSEIRRYLTGEAISARPPTASYLLRVFARRHRTAFVSTAAILVVLAAATVFSSWQYFAADTARAKALAAGEEAENRRLVAEAEQQKAEAVTKLITDALVSSDPNQGGKQDFLVTDAMQQALERIESGELKNQPHTEATLLLTISTILNGNGQSEEALRIAERSLKVNQELHGHDHYEVTVSMSNVGEALLALGRADEALAQFQTVFSRQERQFGTDDSELVATLNNLAHAHYELGQLNQALEAFESALAMARRIHSTDHRDVALSWNGSATCLHSLGRLNEAVDAYQSALDMLARLADGDDPDLATGLNNMAACLRSMGRARDARPIFEKALAMRRRLFNGDHPDVVSSINNLGSCLHTLGHLDEALTHYEDGLAIAQRLFQKDHFLVANGLNSLAACLVDLGRAEEALPKYRAAMEMKQRLYDDDNPTVAVGLAGLAGCMRSLGQYEDALTTYNTSLEMLNRIFENGHPNTAVIMNNMASCLEALGRSDDALEKHREALDLRQRLYEGDHFSIATSLNNVADCLQSLGRPEEALAIFNEALAMYRRLVDGDHVQIAITLSNIGVCLKELDRHDAALASLSDSKEMFQRALPEDHPNILHPQVESAKLLIDLGKFIEAESTLLAAIDVCERSEANKRAHHGSVIKQLIRLYELWDAAEPDSGHKERGATWIAQIDKENDLE